MYLSFVYNFFGFLSRIGKDCFLICNYLLVFLYFFRGSCFELGNEFF